MMRLSNKILFTGLLTLVSIIGTCQTEWIQETLPITNPTNGQLFELKIITPNLVYAVGSKIQSNGSSLGLILKYDGAIWTEMASPPTIIQSIAPIDENDIYALSGNSVFHWDGSNWNDISSTLPDYNANPNFDMRILFKMIAFASNDVWIIGKILNTSSGQGDLETYAVHYDGSSWSVATIPQSDKIDNVGAGLVMEVDATGPDDIWIATRGYIENNGNTQLGIWHYNGSSWSFDGEIVSAAGNVFLRDVSVVNSNDVWFAGYYSPSQGTLAAFYAHYDGTNYTYTDQPLTIADYKRHCIGALDSNNVWSGNQTDGTDFTFFDGTNWTSQTTIISNSTGGGIRDIKLKDGCLWAVGFSSSNGIEPLLIKNCGCHSIVILENTTITQDTAFKAYDRIQMTNINITNSANVTFIAPKVEILDNCSFGLGSNIVVHPNGCN